MLIFLLAVLVLTGAIVVSSIPSLKEKRVLIMSILAILMIMINFINEVDLVVSPPQLLVKVDSSIDSSVGSRNSKKGLTKLTFSSEFPTSDMKHLNEQISTLRTQLQQQILTKGPQLTSQQQMKFSLQKLKSFPPTQHLKPINKPEVYLLEQLKTKIIEKQDWIVYLEGVNKIRFQLLIGYFVKDMNDHIAKYGQGMFEKVVIVPVYQEVKKSQGYRFGNKLDEKDYHIVVVFDEPTETILEFLYETYTSSNKNQYMTIIFLQTNPKTAIFPISHLIQPIIFPQTDYTQAITNYLLLQHEQNHKTQPTLTTKSYLAKIEKQLQMCEKYLQMDYELFMKIIIESNHKSIAKICYEKVVESSGDQIIACVRDLMKSEDDSVPYVKAKKCWNGKKQPKSLVRVKDSVMSGDFMSKNYKVKVRKEHYWANKILASNFGLEVVTKKCTNQL